MNKISLLLRAFTYSFIIILSTNSIGFAKESINPNFAPNCGEWKIESANSDKDQRIGVTLLQQYDGDDCSAMFTLENRTGTLLGGGYTLDLKSSSDNANFQFLPRSDTFLVPGLNFDIITTPLDITRQANVSIQGEVTLGSFLAVDLSFFAMKSIIDLVPVPTGCLISYDQLLLISLRTAPILENTARLAFEGNLIGSKEEFSRVITIFYEKAGDVARDLGIGCFADFLKSIIGKPVVIAKIILSYITWVPVFIFDYFKYQGMYDSVTLSYIPSLLSDTFFFDTRNSSAKSSIILVNGQHYSIRFSGTFSHWDDAFWRIGTCLGVTDASPMFASQGVPNGLVGEDAFYHFAYPRGNETSYTQICKKGIIPFYAGWMEISSDGGQNYSQINPSSGYREDHIYEFSMVGKGKPLNIKFLDTYYQDNYGVLKIEILPTN